MEFESHTGFSKSKEALWQGLLLFLQWKEAHERLNIMDQETLACLEQGPQYFGKGIARMRKQVLKDIEESISNLDMELLHASKDWLTQFSFERWALLEMRDLLLQKPDTDPWVVVEEFMNLMDQYTLECQGNNMAFCVAYDTAWAVLEEIIGGEPPH